MTLPSGIRVDELDLGIRPQDDLFRHVDSRWLTRTEIAADLPRDSTFRILAGQAEKAVREIAEQAASAPRTSCGSTRLTGSASGSQPGTATLSGLRR